MRKITAALIGAAAVAASVAMLRPAKQAPENEVKELESIPAGEKVPARISLERLRELGY